MDHFFFTEEVPLKPVVTVQQNAENRKKKCPEEKNGEDNLPAALHAVPLSNLARISIRSTTRLE